MTMEKQINILNCLRVDFKRWADSNEPSLYELDLNKINGGVSGFYTEDEPTVLLDCNKNEGEWFLSVNSTEDETRCYPIATLTAEQVYDIRICVESWLVRKESSFLFI